MATITITIGRNVGDTPQPAAVWDAFQRAITAALLERDATIYVDNAQGVGTWQGVAEHNATTVAGVDDQHVPAIKLNVAAIGHAFKQDAIAVTVGATSLV